MAVMLGNYALAKYEKGESFTSFFDSHDNKFCTCLTIIYSFLIVIFTVLSYTVIIRNYEAMQHSRSKMGYWQIFFEDTKVDTKQRALYTFYFLIRRLFTVLVLMFLLDYPYF